MCKQYTEALPLKTHTATPLVFDWVIRCCCCAGDYVMNQCQGRAHCIPCNVRFPSCKDLPDGLNPWVGREYSPFFVLCEKQRPLYHGQCDNSKGTQLFDPVKRVCTEMTGNETVWNFLCPFPRCLTLSVCLSVCPSLSLSLLLFPSSPPPISLSCVPTGWFFAIWYLCQREREKISCFYFVLKKKQQQIIQMQFFFFFRGVTQDWN